MSAEDEDMDVDSNPEDLRVPVSGVFSMAASDGESGNQCFLTLEDMEKQLPYLKGMPVRIEHGAEVVGEVEDVTIDDQQRIAGTIRLNRDYTGRRALRLCREGKYKGFSLGIAHDKGTDERGAPVIKDKLILHVALANKPEFGAETRITNIGEDRPAVKIGTKLVKVAAELLRKKKAAQQEKQNTLSTEPATPAPPPTQTRQRIVTLSSLSSSDLSATSTTMASSADDYDRQIAEIQLKRDKARADEQARAQAKAQEEEKAVQPQIPPAGLSTDPATGKTMWTQQPPNPIQSPVVFNWHLNGNGGGGGGYDPLSQMSKAAYDEQSRQHAEAEAFRKQESDNKRGKKRRSDEEEESARADVHKADEKDALIAKLRDEVTELKKTRRTDEQPDSTAPGSATSEKTKNLVDAVTKSLGQSAIPGAPRDDEDDEDIEDKVVPNAGVAAAAAGLKNPAKDDIDGSKITLEELTEENYQLKAAARAINLLEKQMRKLPDGAEKQNVKDELAAKQRKYNAECKSYIHRNNAWMVHQIASANSPVDEDMSATMADYATVDEGLSIKDLGSLRALNKLVTVSHADKTNSLAAANSEFQKERSRFEAESLRLRGEAERYKIAAERAQAHASILSSDPRTKPLSAPRVAPKLTPPTSANSAAAPMQQDTPKVDPKFAFMRTTGIPLDLVVSGAPVPEGMMVSECGKPVDMFTKTFIPIEQRDWYKEPRHRNGLQRQGDEKILRDLDNDRRLHVIQGAADMITPAVFNGFYTAPPNSHAIPGNARLAMLSPM